MNPEFSRVLIVPSNFTDEEPDFESELESTTETPEEGVVDDVPRPKRKKRSGVKGAARVKRRGASATDSDDAEERGGMQRLQRVLAAAGYGSRRHCEELIVEGRVEVDGKLIEELGTQVDPQRSKIYVDGSLLRKQRLVYFLLNKPPGVVTSNRDPQGRTRVMDLIQEKERIFPVGRLDRSSEGLLFMTNDGDLAQQLAHPKFGVRKTYRVTVAGKVDTEKLSQMKKGIYIAEGHVAVEGAKIIRHRAKATDLEILLREGKNREIRRILARLGHKVMTLQRVALGPLRLGDLPRGAYRPVTSDELLRLRDEVRYQSKARAQGESDDDDEAVAVPKRRKSPKKGTVPRKAAAKPVGPRQGVPPRRSDTVEAPLVQQRSKPLEGSKKVGTVIGAESIPDEPFEAHRIPRPKGKAAKSARREAILARTETRQNAQDEATSAKGGAKSAKEGVKGAKGGAKSPREGAKSAKEGAKSGKPARKGVAGKSKKKPQDGDHEKSVKGSKRSAMTTTMEEGTLPTKKRSSKKFALQVGPARGQRKKSSDKKGSAKKSKGRRNKP